jgi:hypothetical protein
MMTLFKAAAVVEEMGRGSSCSHTARRRGVRPATDGWCSGWQWPSRGGRAWHHSDRGVALRQGNAVAWVADEWASRYSAGRVIKSYSN